jgi:hypothetical protein
MVRPRAIDGHRCERKADGDRRRGDGEFHAAFGFEIPDASSQPPLQELQRDGTSFLIGRVFLTRTGIHFA